MTLTLQLGVAVVAMVGLLVLGFGMGWVIARQQGRATEKLDDQKVEELQSVIMGLSETFTFRQNQLSEMLSEMARTETDNAIKISRLKGENAGLTEENEQLRNERR